MKVILNKIINIIREHRLIIVGSLLLTILIFAPLLAFPYVAKNDYQGINISWFGTDSHFYLTKGKEILDGNNLGNPILREGKNEPSPYFSYSEQILLAPIKLLGLSHKVNIVTIYNIYGFIGVFFLICLIYYFVWQLSRKKLLAITAALFAIGGYSIIYNKTLFYSDFNIYARVMYPYISSLGLFLYLNLLVKSLKSTELKYKILAGVSFGLLFYIYFYAWSFILAFNGCLFLIYLFKKDFSSTKKVFFISSVGLALGAYNLFGLFTSLDTEAGKQMAYFMWASYGHNPIFSKVGFVALIIFVAYFYKRREDKHWPFILAIILGGWIALNQQIITGRMIQYGHYYWYFIVPLSIIISLYMFWQIIRNKKIRKFLFLCLILIVFINTIGGQYRSFFITYNTKKNEQNFRPIINILNQEKTPAVILAPEANSYLFTIYTSHDLFWHNVASINKVPVQRLKDALFVYSYLNKEAREDLKSYLEKISDNQAKVKSNFYQNLYRNLEGYWSGYDYYAYKDKIKNDDKELNLKRPEVIDRLNEEYNEIVLENNGINNLLEKYGVNYIVWDKNLNPEWDLGFLESLELLYTGNNIYLYRLVK